MVGKTIIYVQMCELENLNQEDINLLENEINGNNEIYFPEELHNISQLPILSIDEIVDFSKVEIIKTEKPKYKDASQFNDKYLYELYVEIYEKKFKTALYLGEHTWEEWQLFWDEFLSNEYVKEYDQSTYSLEVMKI